MHFLKMLQYLLLMLIESKLQSGLRGSNKCPTKFEWREELVENVRIVFLTFICLF
jgi:hypothetical protein